MSENTSESVANSRASGERLLETLVAIAEYGSAITAKAIAQRTGQPLSTVYRRLAMLKRHGLISELGRDLGVVPGPISLRMVWALDQETHLVNLARPFMQALALESGESVGLMVPAHDRVVCLDMIESPNSLRCSFSRGASFSLLRGASAKALLAHLPQSLREWILAAQVSDPAARDALRESLAQVRARGFVVSDSEVDEGVWGVSVPIFGRGARLQGGLTIMAPSTRALPRQQRLVGLARDAARRIETRLNDIGNQVEET